MADLIQDTPAGSILLVYVQPKAGKTEFVGIHGEGLKFQVAAPPVEGAANEALCRYLARLCSVPKGSVMVVSGKRGRKKRILLKGTTASRIREVLEY